MKEEWPIVCLIHANEPAPFHFNSLPMSLNESIVEEAALEWFGELGYSCLGAEALTPALSHGEREERGGG